MRASGVGLAVVSAATFGTSGPFGDSLMQTGWTPAGAVTVRVAVAALVLAIPAAVSMRGRWHELRRARTSVLVYGVLGVAGAQLFFFNAVTHLSVGVALLLEYSGTLLVVVWMWLRHGQCPRRLTMIGGVVAIIGLVLVLDLTGPQHVDLIGVLFGLGAATGLAAYFVISGQDDSAVPPVGMAWAGMAVGALTLMLTAAVHAVPFHVAATHVQLLGHRTSWIVPVLGVSLVAAVIAYTTGIAAARRLGARVASFVGLAEVLFAILFAWLLVGQAPSWLQAIGGVIVVAGIAVVKLDDRLPAEPAPEPVPSSV